MLTANRLIAEFAMSCRQVDNQGAGCMPWLRLETCFPEGRYEIGIRVRLRIGIKVRFRVRDRGQDEGAGLGSLHSHENKVIQMILGLKLNF